MDRDIDTTLLAWKSKPGRKPLIIRGARQVGKTYAVTQLGRHFDSLVEVNFEREKRFEKIFSGDLEPRKIASEISALKGVPIIPGKTLLFLDEIQVAPSAITSLRYFFEHFPELHVIGAGSLLEFELNGLSVPVGRIDFLYMHPCTFSEFLRATGNSILDERIGGMTVEEPIEGPLHESALSLLREYMYVGGMPKVISRYTEEKSILAAEEEQRSIVQTCRADFAKYTRKNGIEMVENTFAALPAMVGNKTVYSEIDPDGRAYQIKTAIDLLEKARVVTRIRAASGAGTPLAANASEKFFKTTILDVGLMQRQTGTSYDEWSQPLRVTDRHRGNIAEQFAGQELLNRDGPYEAPGMYYWHRTTRGSQAEVDYLIENHGRILPLEVKSGTSNHMRSMLQFFLAYPETPVGIKCSQEILQKRDRILTVPLYAMSQISRLVSAYR